MHGSDGLDEITLTGPTFVASLENGEIKTFEVTPDDAGLGRVERRGAQGRRCRRQRGRAVERAAGKPSAYRDVALLNAAAALIVAGRARDLKEGVAIGTQSLDSGAAAARLEAPGRGFRGQRDLSGNWPTRSCAKEAMSDILTKIETYKREEIAAAKRAPPLRRSRGAGESGRRRPAASSARIKTKHARGDYALIAEVKKASPSKG